MAKVVPQPVATEDRSDAETRSGSQFNSKEALERILDTTIENILSFAQGRPTNVLVARLP